MVRRCARDGFGRERSEQKACVRCLAEIMCESTEIVWPCSFSILPLFHVFSHHMARFNAAATTARKFFSRSVASDADDGEMRVHRV